VVVALRIPVLLDCREPFHCTTTSTCRSLYDAMLASSTGQCQCLLCVARGLCDLHRRLLRADADDASGWCTGAAAPLR
jgi:hypothetical protein